MRARTARRGLLDKAPYDGMSAIGTLGGERGAKRGQHPGRPLPRLDGPVGLRRLVHGVQVATHRRQRPLVLVAAEALDEAGVAHAQAQEEPVGVGLGEGELGGRHCERVPRPDVGDGDGDREDRLLLAGLIAPDLASIDAPALRRRRITSAMSMARLPLKSPGPAGG
jgi:hypothetical protein